MSRPVRPRALCWKAVKSLLSLFNIPTLKLWLVISESFIPAKGRWTLGKCARLLPSEEASVKESESLLLMPPESHSSTSQYHTQMK